MDDTTAYRVTRAFRRFNRLMVLMWRLGLGRVVNAWPQVIGQIMVLSHTGRRTGLQRRTPLNYLERDGVIYAIAGFGPSTDWYRNVRANPQVVVWLPGQCFTGIVEDVSDSPDRLALVRGVLVASGFAAPAAGIPVHRLDDAELAAQTADYRVLRIVPRPDGPQPAAPADLAWVWLPVGAVGCAVILVRSCQTGAIAPVW
ncbi:MAG: nitroreductase family deazaflavin-dependent oxidoreductase, partial [Dermatophilaceae bacterium]